jgi:small subunit ribosomal protein S14
MLVNIFKKIVPKLVPTKTCTTNLSTSILQPKFNLINLITANNLNMIKQPTQLLKPQQNDQIYSLAQTLQKRFNWGYKGRMMLKDIKRRELLRKFAPTRIRLQALRANSILPKVLKKAAQDELQQLTRHSTLAFITNRCAFTSKPGGCLHRWRLSRHVWRDQVDYNHMSGVTRAVWGTPSYNAVSFRFKRVRLNWFNYDGFRKISFNTKSGSKSSYRFKLN